ncbi:MAG: hypothetical protein ACHQJ6_05245 [Candidatus Berkiellales bacterium]
MVLANEATKILMEKFPTFKDYSELETWRDCFEGREITFHAIMAAFSSYVIDIINDNPDREKLASIFDLAEYLMCNGEHSVQEAVATCFLENLINVSSHGDFDITIVVPYLGKESIEYCKAWDEFTGVKTEGLWDKENSLSSIMKFLRERLSQYRKDPK